MLYIFDWDGTLIDSTDKIVRCMDDAITQLQFPSRDYLTIKNIIGLGLPEAIRTLFPDIGDDDMNELRQLYSRNFVTADQVPCQWYPGVYDTLEQLKTQGHTLSVATGKSRKGLNRVLQNLSMQDFFHSSRCADETVSKPDPTMLYQLISEHDVSAADAVMVGDTEFDLLMARNAGMPGIAVSYGAHSVDRLKLHEPVKMLDHFSELLEW